MPTSPATCRSTPSSRRPTAVTHISPFWALSWSSFIRPVHLDDALLLAPARGSLHPSARGSNLVPGDGFPSCSRRSLMTWSPAVSGREADRERDQRRAAMAGSAQRPPGRRRPRVVGRRTPVFWKRAIRSVSLRTVSTTRCTNGSPGTGTAPSRRAWSDSESSPYSARHSGQEARWDSSSRRRSGGRLPSYRSLKNSWCSRQFICGRAPCLPFPSRVPPSRAPTSPTRPSSPARWAPASRARRAAGRS